MVFYTGDIHGRPEPIFAFCSKFAPGQEDIIAILGDVGANYYGASRGIDAQLKMELNRLGPMIFCIHGNHEMRPGNLPTYQLVDWHGGKVWCEQEYPNLIFAKDGEIFDLEGLRHLVIGGAYSVDKYYRIARGAGWWPDEQPSEEIKQFVEQQVKANPIDVVLSHTCPAKYIPTEAFLPGVDQSGVDRSTEDWLGKLEERFDYKAWLCGHWHINKRIDKIHFLFHDFESLDDIRG